MYNPTLSLSFSKQNAKTLFQLLVIIEVTLVAFYLMDHIFLLFGKSHHIFDLDGEANLPSWFSSAQLFFIGIVLFVQLFKTPKLMHISSPLISFIALSFIFLSFDETIQFHEKFPFGFKPLEWLPRSYGYYGAWIPAYMSLAAAFMIFQRKKIIVLWQFYRKELILFSIGMFIFILGGVMLEIISIKNLLVNRLSFLMEIAFEEGFEMFGASIMLYASILLALH